MTAPPRLFVEPHLAGLFDNEVDFDTLWRCGDDIVRDHGNRRTARFARGGRIFYIKRYAAPRRRLLVKSGETATAEVEALRRAAAAGIAVPAIAGHGIDRDGRSLVVLDALPDTVSLETLVAGWPTTCTSLADKRTLINAVAEMVHRLHAAGINHRDLYLPHFHVPRTRIAGALWLIDLQRAQVWHRVPRRWLVKDLGGLWFSAMDAGLTRTDLFRFVAAYAGGSPARTVRRDRAFWRAVEKRAQRTYARHGGVPLPPHLRSAP